MNIPLLVRLVVYHRDRRRPSPSSVQNVIPRAHTTNDWNDDRKIEKDKTEGNETNNEELGSTCTMVLGAMCYAPRNKGGPPTSPTAMTTPTPRPPSPGLQASGSSKEVVIERPRGRRLEFRRIKARKIPYTSWRNPSRRRPRRRRSRPTRSLPHIR